MNNTNWVKSHCRFLKTSIYKNLFFMKMLKMNVIKTLKK